MNDINKLCTFSSNYKNNSIESKRVLLGLKLEKINELHHDAKIMCIKNIFINAIKKKELDTISVLLENNIDVDKEMAKSMNKLYIECKNRGVKFYKLNQRKKSKSIKTFLGFSIPTVEPLIEDKDIYDKIEDYLDDYKSKYYHLAKSQTEINESYNLGANLDPEDYDYFCNYVTDNKIDQDKYYNVQCEYHLHP